MHRSAKMELIDVLVDGFTRSSRFPNEIVKIVRDFVPLVHADSFVCFDDDYFNQVFVLPQELPLIPNKSIACQKLCIANRLSRFPPPSPISVVNPDEVFITRSQDRTMFRVSFATSLDVEKNVRKWRRVMKKLAKDLNVECQFFEGVPWIDPCNLLVSRMNNEILDIIWEHFPNATFYLVCNLGVVGDEKFPNGSQVLRSHGETLKWLTENDFSKRINLYSKNGQNVWHCRARANYRLTFQVGGSSFNRTFVMSFAKYRTAIWYWEEKIKESEALAEMLSKLRAHKKLRGMGQKSGHLTGTILEEPFIRAIYNECVDIVHRCSALEIDTCVKLSVSHVDIERD